MKLNGFICGLTLVGVAGFYSCTSDENLMSDSSVNGKKVPLTITVNRGDVSTRTELSENAEGGLDDKWLAKEVLEVYDASGNNVGELVQKDGYENSPTAVFSGTVTVADGNSGGNYCIWYFGEPVKNENEENTRPYITCENGVATVNLGNQSFKSARDLSVLDVMYQKVAIRVSNGEAFVDADVTMTPVFAMARFSLSGLSEVESGNLVIKDVSASGGNSNATADSNVKYNLATGEHVASGNANALSISVDGVGGGNDVYVALFPKAYTLDFTFTGTSVYTAQITSKKLEAGKYYCALSGEGETGLSGIKVEMTKTGGDENDPYKEYANEDPRNPLHKFAKYNLTRDDNNNMENVFVANDEAYGALYQWGRYYGFIDNIETYKSILTNNVFTINSSSYTQYLDAMKDREMDGGTGFWHYDVVNLNGTAYYDGYLGEDDYGAAATPISAGTQVYDMGYLNPFYDLPQILSSKSKIVTDCPRFIMDGEPIGSGFHMMRGTNDKDTYRVAEDYANSGEYWIESKFGDGGSTWAKRAEMQGFGEDKFNPCPSGWRLPSYDEMKEIVPENGLFRKNGNLSDMLTGYSELRKSKDGFVYAIRWNYSLNNSYLEIEAVVLDDSFTDASQLTTLFWDNHKTDKVVRKFPFTGGIRPATIMFILGSRTHNQMVCRPMPMGQPEIKYIAWDWWSYYSLVGPNEIGSVNKYFGGYWVNEKGNAFKFCANNLERDVNGNVHEEESEYTRVRMEGAQPAFGFAIRPVMDK